MLRFAKNRCQRRLICFGYTNPKPKTHPLASGHQIREPPFLFFFPVPLSTAVPFLFSRLSLVTLSSLSLPSPSSVAATSFLLSQGLLLRSGWRCSRCREASMVAVLVRENRKFSGFGAGSSGGRNTSNESRDGSSSTMPFARFGFLS
ncbi:hypothetical protein DEO72_LG10g3760 [Vigna unguiculata]|uniref:Uncharacterized protein n=1 Tax=Vigna unguiculata TaxID=3917 RepID=A0A4D6NK07_VIGUN|nr:hypothetical protein DEO72_LG10g3760 [Vigna unguiculata]